jgi:hypothetical protein
MRIDGLGYFLAKAKKRKKKEEEGERQISEFEFIRWWVVIHTEFEKRNKIYTDKERFEGESGEEEMERKSKLGNKPFSLFFYSFFFCFGETLGWTCSGGPR